MKTAAKKYLPKIIVIVGPTASGKTALSILAAKKFNGEIINMDSRQVYKDFDIGTDKHIEKGIRHHLFGVVSGARQWTLAEHVDAAKKAVGDILERGRVPILVGGTGLYAQALVENWKIPRVKANKKLRSKLEKMSIKKLAAALLKKDPEAAKIIDLKNKRRIIRALEVILQTGVSFASSRGKGELLYNALILMPKINREEIYEKIDRRVDEQFKKGLAQEVLKLEKRFGWDSPGMQSIGYMEFSPYFKTAKRGGASGEEIEKIKQKIKYDNRSYYKRQNTWFKKMEGIKKFSDRRQAMKLIGDFLNK